MNSFKTDDCTEIFIIDNSVYILRGYDDIYALFKLCFPTFINIRSGSYAFCYDFLATLWEK